MKLRPMLLNPILLRITTIMALKIRFLMSKPIKKNWMPINPTMDEHNIVMILSPPVAAIPSPYVTSSFLRK